MANIISGAGRSLVLSNGSMEVFTEVMMLALTETARDSWGLRFAALIAQQDQTLFGLGCVGFTLEDIDWGTAPARSEEHRAFVLRTLALAHGGHRWADLGYEPPHIAAQLAELAQMVTAFDIASATPNPAAFPADDDTADLSCSVHRVLAPLAWHPACVFCSR